MKKTYIREWTYDMGQPDLDWFWTGFDGAGVRKKIRWASEVSIQMLSKKKEKKTSPAHLIFFFWKHMLTAHMLLEKEKKNRPIWTSI